MFTVVLHPQDNLDLSRQRLVRNGMNELLLLACVSKVTEQTSHKINDSKPQLGNNIR